MKLNDQRTLVHKKPAYAVGRRAVVIILVLSAVLSLGVCWLTRDSMIDVGVDIRMPSEKPPVLCIVDGDGHIRPLSVMAETGGGLNIVPEPVKRFHGFVARNNLAGLAIQFPEGPRQQLVRIYVATLIPSVYYVGSTPKSVPAGSVHVLDAGSLSQPTVSLSSISAIEQGGIITFLVALPVFSACMIFGTWLLRICRSPLCSFAVSNRPTPWWLPLCFFLPLVFVWLFWLTAFYPGSVPGDPSWEWKMPRTDRYSDAHPIFHVVLMWFISRVWDSPAAVALVQIFALAGAVSYGLMYACRLGVRRRWVVGAQLIVMLWPVFAVYSITLWKGVMYSIAILATTIMLIRLILESDFRQKLVPWISLGVLLAVCSLLRRNGLLVSVAMAPLLLLVFRDDRKRVGIALAVIVVTVPGIYVLLSAIYNPAPAPPDMRSRPLQMAVGSLVAQDVPLAANEYQLLDKIRPLKNKWGYDTVQTLSFRYGNFDFDSRLGRLRPQRMNDGQQFAKRRWLFNRKFLRANHGQFIDLAKSLATRFPLLLVKARVDASRYLFRIIAPEDETDIYCYALYVHHENDFVQENSLFPRAKDALLTMLENTTNRRWNWLLWRPALPLMLSVVAVVVFAIRFRSIQLLIVLAPILLTALSIFLAGPEQHVRYMLAAHYCAPFLILLGFVPASAHCSCVRTEQ